MIRIPWKQILSLGFIFFLILGGCGVKHPPVDELLVQAEGMLDAGQIANAILVLERCNEISPDRVDVLESLAFAHAANNDPMLASLTFSRIVELVPSRPEYLLYSGESLLEAGDAKGAIVQYVNYLKIRPEDRAIFVSLSGLYEETGNLGKALETMLLAEQVESRAIQQITIGRLFLQTENLAQAQAWYARAIDGGSETRDEALLGLLETAIRARRFQDAEALLIQLDAEYPGRLERSSMDNVRDQLAEWRRRQDEAMEAVAALEEKPAMTAEAPEDQDTEQVDSESGSIAEQIIAEEIVDSEAVEKPAIEEIVEPETEETVVEDLAPSPMEMATDHLDSAREFRAEGNLLEAIKSYKQALILFDGQPVVWAELSETYLESGNARWAQATASEAMRRDPNNAKWVLQFLRASQQTMESDRLIREMEDAYRKFPNHLEIILVLARGYNDLGNKRNAAMLYGQFLELAPRGHPEHANVMRELESLGSS